MTTLSASPRWGYFCVILAAVLWAVSGSSGKFLFQQGVTPLELVQLRVTLASACLFLWLLVRRRPLLAIAPRDAVYFMVLGVLGMAMVQFTYFYAISKIKVAAAILLQYLAPALIALYSVVFAREKLTRLTLAAIVGATMGCYLVVGAYNLDLFQLNKLGVLGGLCAAVAFAFYSIYGERGMRRYNPWTVLFYALLTSAVFWNMGRLLWSGAPAPFESFARDYSGIEWFWIIYIVVLGTVVPFGLYFEGISLIRSTRASITATLEPITAGVVAYLFLGETMEPLQLLGGLLVIASVIVLQLRQEFDDKAPSIIRARHQMERSAVMGHHGTDHHPAD
ncbi:DMT family transporter [Desulfoferrobacter suflitae]|uniref:DMT family transporter n=1 Tax=Desulfoferrobacter suflitae TaxID=2865782 RepID=UPI002164B8F7|nr:EamA family transporter [Desulfoferrobacter suflitae]MCK8602728.1 EamA family transporter [Desulfoferrobacter suflitae]